MKGGWLAFAAVLMALPAAAQTPQTKPFQAVSDLTALQPRALVRGARSPAVMAPVPPERRTVSARALMAAKAYSDSQAGNALLVWQGGALQYADYGPGLGPASRFNVFSMTKTVLALAYGAAVRDGVIGSIDDPVGKYLVEWRDDPRGAMTLRHLLTMSSGLTLYSLAKPDARTFALTYGPDVTTLSLQTPAAKPPGLEFEYNNIDSQIAGVALARALQSAGKGGYAAWMSQVLWAPAGQADAYHWLEHEGGQPRYFSGLLASAPDWLRVGLIIKDRGRVGNRQVLPASWIDEMTAPSAHNPNYGLQIWMGYPYRRETPSGPTNPRGLFASEPYVAQDLIILNGAFGQRVYVSRSLDLVIVRIGEQRPGWDDSIVPNAIARGLKP